MPSAPAVWAYIGFVMGVLLALDPKGLHTSIISQLSQEMPETATYSVITHNFANVASFDL
jgi:hypothetical protein